MSQFISKTLPLLTSLKVNHGQILFVCLFFSSFSRRPGCRIECENSLGRKWDKKFSLIQRIAIIDATDICWSLNDVRHRVKSHMYIISETQVNNHPVEKRRYLDLNFGNWLQGLCSLEHYKAKSGKLTSQQLPYKEQVLFLNLQFSE